MAKIAAAFLVVLLGGALAGCVAEPDLRPATAPKNWDSLPQMNIFQHEKSPQGEDISRMGVIYRSDSPPPPPYTLQPPAQCLAFDVAKQRVDSVRCWIDEKEYREGPFAEGGYTIRYPWSAYVERGAPDGSPQPWSIVVTYSEDWKDLEAWGPRVTA